MNHLAVRDQWKSNKDSAGLGPRAWPLLEAETSGFALSTARSREGNGGVPDTPEPKMIPAPNWIAERIGRYEVEAGDQLFEENPRTATTRNKRQRFRPCPGLLPEQLGSPMLTSCGRDRSLNDAVGACVCPQLMRISGTSFAADNAGHNHCEPEWRTDKELSAQRAMLDRRPEERVC